MRNVAVHCGHKKALNSSKPIYAGPFGDTVVHSLKTVLYCSPLGQSLKNRTIKKVSESFN